jgi:hypothetical protein
MNAFKDAASRCARYGWPVFPVRPGAKTPQTRNGLKDATTDQGLIDGWWTCWPEANVAVATGSASGLVVVDVDGDEGAESLRALERNHGSLPRTLSVVTPRLGQHYYFAHPGVEVRNSASTLGPGLDVRGDGGYVLVPPSMVGGRRYEPDERRTPAPMPEWLLRATDTRASGAHRTAVSEWLSILRDGVRGPDARNSRPSEGRNDKLTRFVGHLLRQDLDTGVVLELAHLVNSHRFNPPLQRLEVDRLVDSIADAELRRRRAGTKADRTDEWPEPLGADAFHGLAGEVVRRIEPQTEADPAAILGSFLVAFGNVISRGAGWKVGATFHATNLFMTLVGPTSSGRKGTACDEVRRIFDMAERDWCRARIVSGLSTGEGLVWQVRDPITRRRKAKKGEAADVDGMVTDLEDPGEPDKRLLVIEPELSQALKVMARDGNTLSPTLRLLWDRGDARSMVKTSPGRTTDALVSIIGHITPEEYRRQLSDTEIANGFVNRFAIVCSNRSKRLPFGGSLEDRDLETFVPRLRAAIDHGKGCREIGMDESARRIWPAMYEALDADRHRILGAVLRRATAIVRRFAVVYALLDCENVVRDVHLQAAAAYRKYCEDSARYVFGDALGGLAEKLRTGLRESGQKGMTRAEVRAVAGSNNIPASEIDAALRLLLDQGLAERESEATGGRPAERWRSREKWEK